MGLLSLCGTAGAAEGAQAMGADLPASDSGLSAYLQGEVLVQYAVDGFRYFPMKLAGTFRPLAQGIDDARFPF